MTGIKYKYTDTNAPTMAEECYNISRKKSCYFRLQKRLNSLENRLELLDDDMLELRREIDDIKKKLSDTKCPASQKFKSKNKYRGEAPLLCNNTSSDSD